MFTARGLLSMASAFSIGISPAVAIAQDTEEPCVCPTRAESGGVAGLLGLAALGLARIGTGVRAFVAEPVAEGPVLAAAPLEEAAPPAVAGAPLALAPDTTRDTTEAVAPQAAPATTAAPRQVAMAAPPQEQPLGVTAPRTATQMPLLALFGAMALLTGVALLVVKRREAAGAASTPFVRPRYTPATVVLLGGKPHRPPRHRIR